jgi:CcmD family protein
MQILLDAGVAIYIAMSVALVVWLGIFLYLLRMDAEAKELKRMVLAARTHSPTQPSAVLVEHRTPSAQ